MMFDPHPKKKADVLHKPCLLMSCHQRFGCHQENKTSQCFHKKDLWFQVAKRKRRQYHFESGILCTLYVDIDKKSFDKLTIGKQLYLLIGKLM